MREFLETAGIGSLAAALTELMDRPAIARAFGEAGRASVETAFSFSRMVAGFESLYLSEVSKRGARPALRESRAREVA